MYLFAIIDWYSRKIVAWELSKRRSQVLGPQVKL
jgi:hypothetical protein